MNSGSINQDVSAILARISLWADLVNALLNTNTTNTTFGMLTHFYNAINDIFPEENFWAFFEKLDSFFDQLTQTQLDFLLNAVIHGFRLQNSILETDGWKMGPLLPEHNCALERLLEAGAKPFQLTLEYVVERGNAHVLWILCKNNALSSSTSTTLCEYIHIGRPWEFFQLEVLKILLMYGKVLNIQDRLRNLFGRFLTVDDEPSGQTKRYVELLIFGLLEMNTNGLKIPNGVKIKAEWISLLQQRENCRMSTLTLLGIFRKRRDAFPSNAFPRDIARIISQHVWDSRDAWERASQTSHKIRKI